MAEFSTPSTTTVVHSPEQKLHNFSWQQTMLRIKDPKASVSFYEKNFGFRLIHKYDFPQWSFSLYFLTILPEGETTPEPGTKESETYLWTMPGTCLELTHNYGTENDDNFKVNNGNVEPHRGFGHIAVMTPDVYAACTELEASGVRFQKKPDEGRMKGLAFALDPDGYWVEIISRSPSSPITMKYTYAQTMLRVKDIEASLRFYRDLLGMSVVGERHMGVGEDWAFSLYFLAHLPEGTEYPDPKSPEARDWMKTSLFGPVLELTYNHGTEKLPDFKYHNGNDQDEGQIRGFGHTGFLVNDLQKACDMLERESVRFKKRPEDGTMRGLAFVFDPDNYWVELIQRDGMHLIE
eukprot:CAMPEP_0182428278 /NCGR_PEP_ID=MMETSP1167-20130531/21880_1 /TAXON_ID=2988 /ORGANISM="Mallomonas Sp, Strain CCMP3275" /LENGTH=349 /DNA_ID=CAMNT_0024611061 /DNA_START=111 /DNA_END=1160 /DNA_ORIENTATION=+